MSGQLVGEVLDAAEAGYLDGLSAKALYALLAIAERCHHVTRQGAVRRARIQAAIHAGNSSRTVDRAVSELKNAGLVKVVKHGYRSHGVGHASVYELLLLPPPKTAEATESACATRDGESKDDVLPPISDVLPPKSRVLPPPMDGEHDGPYNGSFDGGARAGTRTDRPDGRPPVAPPKKTCTQHPNWNDWPCARCKADKHAYGAWLDASRRLLAELDALVDITRDPERAAQIRVERRTRIAVFQRLGEPWK
ncbi:hypothetical protein [Mycobacterium sp. E3305]|uniref:hypothetical protein n=1 Tax=Mycobacterium sp. E3305 TaxID=1834145 RepID=UPI000A8A2AE5|nr:hypothetical protein [Mycobacterium sp. E3305]